MFRVLLALVVLVGLVAVVYLGCDNDDSTGPTTQPRYHNPADTLFEVQIKKIHSAELGDSVDVDVTVDHASANIAGFDVLLGYDSMAIHLDSVCPGSLSDCGWELFDYEFFDTGGVGCEQGRPSGLVRVRGGADRNNWMPLDDGSCTDSLSPPITLFTLSFQVTDDHTYECMYVPIRFLWCGCEDNQMWLVDSSNALHQLACRRIIDFDLTGDISDSTYGHPTYTGFQQECRQQDDHLSDDRLIDFINGGIDIYSCAGSVGVAPQPPPDR
ncbi:MAG: hypothetical protein ABIE70_01030 [bacterium]